jgi:F-type H+-transporting ATPase subunit b
VGDIAQTFGVDWPHLTAQVISFSIVCVLLYRLAYRPVLAMLAQRRETIAQGLANTEKINAALAAIDRQREQILAAARDEGARLLEEARVVARRMREQETQRAAATANRIVLKAREQADSERALMVAMVKRDIGHLVVETTAAVAGKVLTLDDHRRLVHDATRQLKAA